MHQVGCMPQKRKKYQRSRDLREIKRQLKAFQNVQVDIKYLDDIPEFYQAYTTYNLPRYQITARCVRTGALCYMRAMFSFLQEQKPGKVMQKQAIEPAIEPCRY